MNNQNNLDAHYWEDRYRNQQTGWDRGEPSPSLIRWLDSDELSLCRIVVPGAGHGHEVCELARRGFPVTALDFAETPVRKLRSRLEQEGLQAEVVQTDVLHFEPARLFDAVYEQTCLCALNPKQWAAYEQRLSSWLAEGGRLYVCFMQTCRRDGPPFHCPEADMRALFAPERWQWPLELSNVDHPAGLKEMTGVLVKR